MEGQDVYSFVQGSVTAFGGFGIGLAALLILFLRMVIPRKERRFLRAPIFFLVGSVVLTFSVGMIEESPCGDGEACIGGVCHPPLDVCVADSDCDSDFGCVEERCRLRCDETLPCPGGEYCARGLCRPVEECASSDQCQSGTICDDGRCRTQCGGRVGTLQYGFIRFTRVCALTLLLLSIARTIFLLLLFGVFERRRHRGQKHLPGIFRDIIQVSIYAIVGLLVLHETGVEPGSLLTTSALLTAVIGLSLQDTLGNLFAGLAIQTQEPFEVGDWIQFNNDDNHIGEVLEINWRATRILTIDRIEVTVPNNMLARSPIRNFSRPSRLVRRSATVIAPYSAPPARVHRLIAQAVLEVDGVVADPPPDTQTIEFTERGVEYRVRYFIEAFDQRELIDSRVRDRLWYALRRAALPIPPPQRAVTVTENRAVSTDAQHAAHVAGIEKALEQVPLFQPLTHELIHEVAIHTERRLYAPREIVIQQGDYGAELFVVEKGDLDVLLDAHDGMRHVATLRAGDFFGEMSLLTGEQRRATVRTEGECTLLVVSKDALQPVFEAAPDLADKISEVLTDRDSQLRLHPDKTTEPINKASSARQNELLHRIREFFSL